MAAFIRAYHHAHAIPRIVEDSLAGVLLSTKEREAIEGALLTGLAQREPERVRTGADRATLVAHAMRDLPAVPIVLARARYAEDKLAEAIRNGVGQYVIIGAGLDTYALRRSDRNGQLRVLEIDHPATQAFKRRRLLEAGIALPPNLHFGPADLETESIAGVLSRLPCDRTKPSFFSWLGVTMYLTGDAVMDTLSQLGDWAAAGSHLVFDYLDRSIFAPGNRSPASNRVIEFVRRQGEPLLSGFDPSTLETELIPRGFRLREDLGPAGLEERYFKERSDGLLPGRFAHLAHATTA